MAKYTPLKDKAKQFVKEVCSKSGNSLLVGKSTQRNNDNPNGVLPIFNPLPETGSVVLWTSQAKYNQYSISNNQMLGAAIIYWYDYYGNMFNMDANFLLAQAYIESGFNIWNYSLKNTASGISQLDYDAIYKFIFTNPKEVSDYVSISMTPAEIQKISKNLNGNYLNKNDIDINTPTGRKNRPILHQNIIDNPEIMIKAQYRYAKYLAEKYNPLASCVLFGYYRKEKYIRDSYTETIAAAKKAEGDVYSNEGVLYVKKIFDLLYKSFGYIQLEMNQTVNDFDSHNANVSESDRYGNIIYPADRQLTKHLWYRQAISYASSQKDNERKKHANIPNEDELARLIYIGKQIYDPLYDYLFGLELNSARPISSRFITTGYRGDYLNGVVGGVEQSQHKRGEALDLDIGSMIPGKTNTDIFYYIAKNLNFDQLIWEEGNQSEPDWIHVSLRLNSNGNEKKLTVYTRKNGYKDADPNNIDAFNKLKNQFMPKSSPKKDEQ